MSYLARHPDAQDTVDGILDWWVSDSGPRTSNKRIARAIKQLVCQGALVARVNPDSRVTYRLAPAYLHKQKETDGVRS